LVNQHNNTLSSVNNSNTIVQSNIGIDRGENFKKRSNKITAASSSSNLKESRVKMPLLLDYLRDHYDNSHIVQSERRMRNGVKEIDQ
jgi:hypothetical protein